MKTKLIKKLPKGNSKKTLNSELKALRSTRSKITWQIRRIKKALQ